MGPEHTALLAVAVLAVAFVVTDGPLFDLFAYPGDYEDGRLYGLLTFVLAATTLGLIAVTSSMSIGLFVGTVLLIGYGSFAETLTQQRTNAEGIHAGAFSIVGASVAIVGTAVSKSLGNVGIDLPVIVFLAVSGALLAAILRDVLIQYDDPVVMLVVGLLLWLLSALEPTLGMTEIVVALGITVAIGYVSYALGAASIAGMLTGILLGLLTIVLGGYNWFAILIAFFGIGSLSTKFRYDQKASRGIAEENDGARGSANVLSNAAVALVAVLGYAASSSGLLAAEYADVFLFAFAGSLATALSDTLSSEIGGIFDDPILITSFERVEPGTDGGVTWQGELAGIAGALVVALLAVVLFDSVGVVGGTVIVAAGFVGMTVDSLLGATLEGHLLGNQGVNFLATLSGALVCALVVLSMATFG